MLTSYKNNPKLKERFLEEIEKHRLADSIIDKIYFTERIKYDI